MKNLIKINIHLDPDYVTGFCDGSRRNKSSSHKSSECTALVIWGTNLSSTVGYGRFTKIVSNMIKLPPYQHSVVIGLLLSDGWLSFPNAYNKNVRLGFEQSGDHSEYFWFVFFHLAHYCSSKPIIRHRTRIDKQTIGLQFMTRLLPCFTELYHLFYVNGKKGIPNNIYDLLTPVALAHIIMGDGYASRHGLIICTNSYSIQDIFKIKSPLVLYT